MIGTSPVPLTITFDNTAPNGAGNIGYAPFLDVYFPAGGADGATAPVDGLDYIPLSATYLGEPVTEMILTFPAGPLGGACGVTESSVAHPYLPVSVCGQPNDKLVVFLLPLASLTPDQPPIVLELNAELSNFADANTPLTLYARGGYRYDAPVAGNPFLSDATPATMTDNPAFSITPTIVTVTKTSSVGSKSVTGPNMPHTYTITTTVAPGQTITNYDIFDYVDDNIVIVGVVAPGASSITLGGVPAVFPAGPVVANGTANRLVITYLSITGTVSATISYFVPLLDAGGINVVTANNGTSSPTENRVNGIGDFDPLDPRDLAGTNNALAGNISCPACPPTISQTNQAMSLQKSVVNLSSGNNTPGDVLQYTLTMALSDFFALDNVVVFDVISDGQRITGNPIISYTQHGITVGGAMVNFAVREYFTGGAPGTGGLPDLDVPATAGDTVLALGISADLALQGYNELLGGCVPTGGTGANPLDCNLFNASATTLTITYQTTIQDAYTDDSLSGDFSLDMTDTVDNVAYLRVGTVLNTANLAPTGVGSAITDTSTISLASGAGVLIKEIIAVNGVTPVGTPTINVSDTVTFRLRMTTPSSDFENLSISDFLPDSVFDAVGVTVFNNVISNGSNTFGVGIPNVGQAMWGPTGITDLNTNFATIASPFTPTIVASGGVIPPSCGGGVIDVTENTLMFCFGDYDSSTNVTSTIDILFTVQAQAFTFPNNFMAGNLAQTSITSTQNNSRTFDDLTRMILGSVVVNTIKTIDGTSEAHTNDLTADTNADPRPVAVGEVITYRLVVEIPEGTSSDVQFTDTLAPNVEFIAGSARISYSANNAMGVFSVAGILNEINPTTTIPAGLITFGVTGPRELRFDIGQVANNDTDNTASVELLIIEYQAVVVNTADNTIGAIFANDFEVDLNNDGIDDDVSNEVFNIIHEPVINMTKSINTTLSNPTGTTTFDSGDTVIYDISVTPSNGANMTTAFDLIITDAIDPNLDLIDVDFFGTPIYASTADNSDYTMPVQTVSATITELRVGDSITIRVTATVLNTVTIGQIIPNSVAVTWTSLPGNQGTGNATPGNSGDTNGERNGSGGTNDYIANTTVNFTAGGTVNTIKTIDGTSEAHTNDLTTDTNADPRPVAVGEVITYRLVAEMPEGTSPDVQFTDTLAPNVELIAGTARISYSANNAFTGAGTYGLNEINPTTPVPGGLITFGVTGPRELRFDMGQVVNNDTDNAASAELLIIEYQVVVVNTADNVIGAIFANDFEIDLNNDGTDDDVSNEVFNIVQEPVITATKAIIGAPPTDALEVIIYDIVITAGNGANQQNAYDLNLIDVLHPDVFLDSVVIQTNPGYVTIDNDASTYVAGGTVNITLNRLQAGDSVVIRIFGTVLTTVSPNETIPNSATVTWTSLPGAQGTGNATPGNSGDADGERNGSGGVNDYTVTTNTVNFTISSGLPVKTIDATSETATPDTADGSVGNERPVSIGEVITYRLQAVLPESTTISFRVADDLPSGLQFVAGSARVSYLANFSPSFNGDFGGIQNETEPSFPFPASRISIDIPTNTVSFDFGSIINNDGDSGFEFIIIEFNAVVLDVAVPANNNGDILSNDFDVVIDEGLPTEVIATSNSVGVRIVEPAMTVTKTFTPDIQVRGGITTMTLVLSNLASNGATAPIHDMQVTDILDDWLDVTSVNVTFNATATTFGSTFTDNSVITAGFATGVTDNLDVAISGLPIDGVATITVNLAIDPNADPLLLSRIITNTANFAGDSLETDISPDDQDRAYTANPTDDLNVVKPTLLVTKTDSTDPVSAGASMNYTVTIQNTGTPNFGANNVVLTDQIPTGFVVTLVTPSQGACVPILGGILTCNISTIASGASANVVITGYYPTTTANGTIANNIAYVTSTEGNNGNDGNDTPADGDDERAEEPTTILRQVDVEIAKTVDNPAPSEGDTITYTLTITNNGPAQATNVIMTDSIPAGLTFVQFLPISAPCTYAAPTLTCFYPILNVGQTVTVDIEATVDVGASGIITNTASVTTTEPESNLGNNSDDVDIAIDGVDLAITKTVDNPAPSETDTIIYSVNLENVSLTNATNIIITDLLPAGVTYVSHVAPLDSASVMTTYVSGTGAWSIGQLDAGANITLQITAAVDVGVAGTSITNTATLTSLTETDGNSANNTSTAIISVDAVDIEVIKTVSPLATSQGNPVTYTVTVTNIGTVTATGVIISENVPMDGVNTTYVSHLASQGTFTVGTPGIWNIGTLTAGQSVTLDLTVTVEIAGGQINNTATLTGINETDVNPANNSDNAIVTVGPNADLSLTKTISDTTPQIGDTIIYTLIITNAGPDSTDNVVVTDTLPPTVTYAGVNTPSQGAFDGTVWTVGTLGVGASAQLDITVTMNSNGGTTTNRAEVTASDLPDPDSIPNNGATTEDDYAEVAFLFDPPFGRKTFNDAGLPELEWTVVWVNPSNAPIAVTMSDPLLDGTTFVAGSLTCTSPGTLTVNTCIYDALNNEIVFDGIIFPDVGATPATIDSATNRLIITYRVSVPSDVTTVSNIATLNTTSSTVAVSNVFNRSTGGGGGGTPLTAEEIQAKITALPATGESPIWADNLRVALLVMIPLIFMGIGGYWWWRRRSSEQS